MAGKSGKGKSHPVSIRRRFNRTVIPLAIIPLATVGMVLVITISFQIQRKSEAYLTRVRAEVATLSINPVLSNYEVSLMRGSPEEAGHNLKLLNALFQKFLRIANKGVYRYERVMLLDKNGREVVSVLAPGPRFSVPKVTPEFLSEIFIPERQEVHLSAKNKIMFAAASVVPLERRQEIHGAVAVVFIYPAEWYSGILILVVTTYIAGTLIAILGTILFTRYMIHQVTEPITSLTRATQRITGSEFDLDLPQPAEDEVGILTQSFQTMASELRATMGGLKKSNDELEKAKVLIEASEKRYRELYDNAPIMYMSMDTQGIITECNETGFGMLELKKEEMIGKPLTEIVSQGSQVTVRELLKKLELGRETEEQIDLARSGERVQTLKVRAVPVYSTDGMFIRSRVVAEDITEKKKLEEALREKERDLIKAEKLGSLAFLGAGAAHELNNPLTVILGRAQMVLSGRFGMDKITTATGEIQKAAVRCASIIRDLLVFSEKSQGNGFEGKSRIPVGEIIDNSVSHLTDTNGLDGIEVEKSQVNGHLSIVGEKNRLVTVFVNLLKNAREALDGRGEGRITLACSQEPGWVRVDIRDNGCGIREDLISKVFDPFFTTKPIGKGIGLGLSVCYGIVKEHGGRIEVSSREGEGSTFSVFLPSAP